MINADLEEARRRADPSSAYRLENIVLFLAGAVGIIVGVMVFRQGASVRDAGAAVPGNFLIGLGPLLAFMGVTLFVRGLIQGRVRITADQPEPLARTMKGRPGASSVQSLIDGLQDGLSEVAPTYRRVDFLLTQFPAIDEAPIQVQYIAQAYLRNIALIAGIGIGYLMCLVLTHEGPVRNAVSGIYFIVLLTCAFRVRAGMDALSQRLIYFAWFLAASLPVGWQLVLKDFELPEWLADAAPPTGPVVLVFLAVAALFLAGTVSRVRGPTKGRAAKATAQFATNANPVDVFEELADYADNLSTAASGARTYILTQPTLPSSGNGPFDGCLMIESEQFLIGEELPGPVTSLFTDRRFLWAACLTLFAGASWVIFFLVTALAAGKVAAQVAVPSDAAWPLASLAVARFSLQSAHLMWSRMDFRSWILLADLSGNSQSSKMAIRPGRDGGMETETNITRINNFRITVHVAEVRSIAFGVDGERKALAFIGDRVRAQQIVDDLVAFAQNQTSIVAPQSQGDLANAQQIAAINATLKGKPAKPKLPRAKKPRSLPSEPPKPPNPDDPPEEPATDPDVPDPTL